MTFSFLVLMNESAPGFRSGNEEDLAQRLALLENPLAHPPRDRCRALRALCRTSVVKPGRRKPEATRILLGERVWIHFDVSPPASGIRGETMWGEKVGDRRYRLCNESR